MLHHDLATTAVTLGSQPLQIALCDKLTERFSVSLSRTVVASQFHGL
jgi:hypothetical protein